MTNAKKKILILEDEQFTLKLYTHLLAKAGYEVKATPQANEAVRLANDFKPDLFIIDLMLQDGDGFSVIKELHQTTIFKKTPVLVLSNLGQETDVSEAKKRGATAYLIKSNVRFEDILATVKKLLG